MRNIDLTQMRAGQSGVIVGIMGGRGMNARLDALGVRVGKRITKVSSMFMRGPVTIGLGRSRIAIGFGMAKRVLVEVD